jgi:hypothetical protein
LSALERIHRVDEMYIGMPLAALESKQEKVG